MNLMLDTEYSEVNTMPACALAFKVTKATSDMALTVYNRHYVLLI